MAKRFAGRYGYPSDDPFRVPFAFDEGSAHIVKILYDEDDPSDFCVFNIHNFFDVKIDSIIHNGNL